MNTEKLQRHHIRLLQMVVSESDENGWAFISAPVISVFHKSIPNTLWRERGHEGRLQIKLTSEGYDLLRSIETVDAWLT